MRFRLRLICVGTLVSMIVCLPIEPIFGQSTVFMDFSNFQTRLNTATTSAGVGNFSAAETTTIRNNIVSTMQTVYSGYSISFTTSNPGGVFSTLDFNQTAGAGLLGLADAIDFRNFVKNDVARVYTSNFDFFIEAGDPRATQIAEISMSLAGTAAHELGHNLGLEHRDAFGLIGMPPSNATGGGLSGGIQNSSIMATGGTGLTETQRETLRFLSDLSHVKLEFADAIVPTTLPVTNEQAGAHGTAATAQALTFSPLSIAASNYDLAAVVRGTISASLQSYYYRFDMQAGQLMTMQVISDAIFANSIDSVLQMFDTNGTTMLVDNDDTSYDAAGINPGASLYSTDSSIYNFQAATTGTYFLRLATFGGINTGSYEAIFATNLVNAIPEPGGLAVLCLLGLVGYGYARPRKAMRKAAVLAQPVV